MIVVDRETNRSSYRCCKDKGNEAYVDYQGERVYNEVIPKIRFNVIFNHVKGGMEFHKQLIQLK